MSINKLKIRHCVEQLSLKSKLNQMTKPYETTKAVGKVLSLLFKIFVFAFFAGIIIFPFIFMISQSLVDYRWENSSATSFVFFPKRYDTSSAAIVWKNYKDAFTEGYFQAVLFTVGITTLSILVRIFFSITLGYALSMKNWRGRAFSFTFFLSLMIIPEIALLSGQYYVIIRLGWQVSAWLIITLIIPFAASIFFSYMYKNAFEAIPDSVKESSMLDGASGFTYFAKIALPMVKSTTWTVAILTAFASWNSYTWPALLLSSNDSTWTVMNIWVFKTGKDTTSDQQILRMSIRLAGTVLAILPMWLAYFVFRKRIMNAISRNGRATKG